MYPSLHRAAFGVGGHERTTKIHSQHISRIQVSINNCSDCVCVLSRSAMSDSLRLCGLQPTRLLCPWNSPGKSIEWGAIPFSRGSSQPRDRMWSSALWADSLPSEPPGKPIFKVFIALVTILLLLFYVPLFFLDMRQVGS